jgi:heptosyltransferase-3
MERIVVIRGGALGDGVVTLPAIHSLTGGSPQAQLGVIGSPYLQRLAMPAVFIDQGSAACTWLFADGTEVDDDSPPGQLLARADLVLAYTPYGCDSALSRNLQAVCSGDLLHWDPRPSKKDCHIVDHLLGPLQQAGMATSTRIPSIQMTESERTRGETMMAERRGKPMVLLHPGSGGADKRWPLQSFQVLAEQLTGDGVSCAMICGPAEDTDSQIKPTSEVALIRQDCLSDLIALSAAADLFVGNDSGPGHVAAAVGTPTITLFGPTNPAIWRPLATHSHVVNAPDGTLEFLEVADVRRAALSVLSHGAR